MKKVVIGFLGSQLDSARNNERWDKWRPSVALCMQNNLKVDRFEMLYQSPFRSLQKEVAEDIAVVSPETEVRAHLVEIDDAWDFESVYSALHDFARQYPFVPDEEEYLIHISTGTHVCQICLFLLTESRHFPGKLLQTSPVDKKRHDPAGRYSIIDLDLSRYDRLAERFQEERSESLDFLKSGIATRNTRFNQLIEEIELVAKSSQDPILLTGPTGAGKSQLAKRIYELKRARGLVKGRFLEVNCATLRGDSAMSALFGHKKGAFTGAATDRAGVLKSADSGVVFLDEIGQLGLDEQAMLLRALEEKRFFPLGSDEETSSDFQLISGTNRDLLQAVRDGSFRADLFARLNLWMFALPGLRERREDIQPNLDYELQRISEKSGHMVRFNQEARRAYLRFAEDPTSAWQGNFRDLNASLNRMAVLAGGKRISEEIVTKEVERLRMLWGNDSQERQELTEGRALLKSLLGEQKYSELDPFDLVQLSYVVSVCRESRNLAEAGRRLFCVSRQERKMTNDSDRIRKYLTKWNIDWQDIWST